MIRIAVTGPESTAKSTLSKALAEHFEGVFIPEYAREYFLSHPSAYTFEDLEMIAKKQVDQFYASKSQPDKLYFFDTWLIITKIWFLWVYNREPDWLEAAIVDCPIDLYLLCVPDIPWEPDPLRENGGEKRLALFQTYKRELLDRRLNFVEISGFGEKRLQNAIQEIRNFIKKR